jgi:hypothetical protein
MSITGIIGVAGVEMAFTPGVAIAVVVDVVIAIAVVIIAVAVVAVIFCLVDKVKLDDPLMDRTELTVVVGFGCSRRRTVVVTG